MKSAKEIAASLSSSTRAASNDLRDGLESVRSQIAKLQRQTDELFHLPVSLETALTRMENWVDQEVELSRQASMAPSVQKFSQRHLYDERIGQFFKREQAGFAFMGPTIKKCLADEIRAAYSTAPVITDDDREAKLDALDRQLLDAELTEESIIRSAESAGFAMKRRRNADPRAVLAADKDLP